jgi:predicted PurR-regulated permease PerM
MMEGETKALSRTEIGVLVATLIAMGLVLRLHLLAALFAGLLVHELVHVAAPRMFVLTDNPRSARLAVIAMLTVVVIGLTTLLGVGIHALFRTEGGGLALLMQRMAEIIDGAKASVPDWIQPWLPRDSATLSDSIVNWLRTHADELKLAGGEIGRTLAYLLIGMVIGALISVREVLPGRSSGPLGRGIARCAVRLADAFHRMVFAQVRIAALNAVFTAVYLFAVLPIAGVHLPYRKTLVALTFVVGFLPIVGNVISNSAIVVISLSHSLQVAVASLVYMVLIHKLEYFLNARIVGSRIHADAWELLVAMLVMEAAFGIPGIIAAPVFYAYLKADLKSKGLI